MLEGSAAVTVPDRIGYRFLLGEHQVHNRTPFLLAFHLELPPCHLGPGWRRRLPQSIPVSRGRRAR